MKLHVVGTILLSLALTIIPASSQEQRPGVGVDGRGGAVVDPTENVKALNAAEAKRQDDLRSAEAKFQNAAREAETRLHSAIREAETRRINELAQQKQLFDLELARILKASVDEKSLLLATQLREVKTDLSERMAKQEQFRWETGGRGAGIGDLIGWIVAGLMFLIATGSLAINALRKKEG
jgi:hypothetical protein